MLFIYFEGALRMVRYWAALDLAQKQAFDVGLEFEALGSGQGGRNLSVAVLCLCWLTQHT